MSIYTELMILTAIVVFIVDASGWTQWWKGRLDRRLRKSGREVGSCKPFDCSLCCTFWAGLAFLAFRHCLYIESIGIVCLCALMAKPLGVLMNTTVYFVSGLIEKLTKLIDKLYD